MLKPHELLDTPEPRTWAENFIIDIKTVIGGRPIRQSDMDWVHNWFHHAMECGRRHGGHGGPAPEKPLLETILDEVRKMREEVKNEMADNKQALLDVQTSLNDLKAELPEVTDAMNSAVTEIGVLEQKIVDLQAQVAAGASNADVSAGLEDIAGQVGNITPALKTAAQALKAVSTPPAAGPTT